MGSGLWQLLPDGLGIELAEIDAHGVTIGARSTASEAECPVCCRPSSRIHRYCERTLGDLPWSGRRVRLVVRARHFRCRNPDCPRKVFSERLVGTAAVYARRTERLSNMLLGIAYELGGEAGSRAAAYTGIDVSGDTLLDIIRAAPIPEQPTRSTVGVDDWSWRKGMSFGTVLVDLQGHQPVDLLRDRSSDSFSSWLKEHPGVEVIARDRGDIYAEGARKGAPDAVQVADRWHLLKNLSEVVERFLQREHKQLDAATGRLAAEAMPATQKEQVEVEPTAGATAIGPTREERRKIETWTRRKARYDRVVDLRQGGHSYESIARQVGLSKMTVIRYLRVGDLSEHFVDMRKRRPHMLDAYEMYLRQEWDEGCQNAAELWRRLTDKGMSCSRATVGRYVEKWRPGRGKPGKPAKTVVNKPARKAIPPRVPSYTPRRATWLLLKRPDGLHKDAARYLDALLATSPEMRTVSDLANEFHRVVRQRDLLGFQVWIESARSSSIPELVAFAGGLQRDRFEVEAALSTEWSNGQVEGQINRLKMLKRQMFGRAGFELLRRRVLPIRSKPTKPVFGMSLPAVVGYSY